MAPVITHVTATYDMGYEFSAVVPGGVIYAVPGMLLNYSGGEWPPNQWDGKTEEEYKELLRDFMLNKTWEVIAWSDLSDGEIEQWLEATNNAELYQSHNQEDDSPDSY